MESRSAPRVTMPRVSPEDLRFERELRPSAFADFVGQDTIKDNLAHTGLAGRARVVRGDAFAFLKRPDLEPFDLVYVAPPQYKGLWAKTVRPLEEGAVLAPGGLVVAQIHPKEYQELGLETLVLTDQRRYGSTMLCFYGATAEKGGHQGRGDTEVDVR